MINWKVRIKNKNFWLTIIPAFLLVLQTILAVFNVNIDFGDIGNKLLAIVNAVFAVLTVLGVVTDHTTEGIGDSKLAMTYDKPKARG